MRLAGDPTVERVALTTIRQLIEAGFAGLDEYDRATFVVDVASTDARDDADVALDTLGASFLRDDGLILRCVLPRWVLQELELEGPGAPTLVTTLASRTTGAHLDALITDIAGRPA